MIGIRIPLEQLQLFFLIFVRVSVMLVSMPLFDNRSIPPILKGGLCLAVTFLVYPLLAAGESTLIPGVLPLALGIAAEVIMGIAIGFTIRLVFTGIQMAGQLAGFQMGFAVVNVMDPISSTQVSIIAQLNYLIAILLFLSLNAHHVVLHAVAESFTVVPPMGYHLSGGLTGHLVDAVARMFEIAVKVGAPVIVALLLASAALGIVARTVPQMNIFIVAFPLKIVVGLAFIIFTLPHISGFLEALFAGFHDDILTILRIGRP